MGMIEDMWPPQSADEAIDYLAEYLEEESHDPETLEVAEQCRRWAVETRRRASAMRALEELTPNGSEFVGDVEACRKWIIEARQSKHEALKRYIKRAHAAEREVEEL